MLVGRGKFDEWVGLGLGAGFWLLGLAVERKGPAAGGLRPEHLWGRGIPRQGFGSFTLLSTKASWGGWLL